MTPDQCDLCGSTRFEEVYRPIGSLRQVSVAVCRQCGFVFSRYADVTYSRAPRASGDADWGNIRWAKGFRLDALRPLLEEPLREGDIRRVLDVGANRGSFLEWLLELRSDVEVTAVEPDERVVTSYRDRSGIDVRVAKLEQTELEPQAYDFAYCCQTLEHADSVAAMLARMHAALKVGGTLFIEVPNIEVISYPLTVEEFFIDKHTAHFNHRLLCAYVEWAGFRLEDGTNAENDILNVRIVATKTGPGRAKPFSDELNGANRAAHNVRLLQSYAGAVARNRAALPVVVDRLNRLQERQSVAFWGATTIFDLLVKYGGLEPSSVERLVDSYVHRYLPEHHGVRVESPTAFRIGQPDVCIVLARFSAGAIAEAARRYGVRNVISFSDLLESALASAADGERS